MQIDSTIYNLKIGQCENQDEYEQLVREHQQLYKGWADYIGPKVKEKRLKRTNIAQGCGVSRTTASGFLTSIPTDRRSVIMLAMMLGLTVEQTDEMLVRWAKFQRLYPKHPEDMIWIHLLRRGGSRRPKQLFEDYYSLYREMLAEFLKYDGGSAGVMDTYMAYEVVCSEVDTGEIDPREDTTFKGMVSQLLPSFRSGYAKLMRYIDEQFQSADFMEFTMVSRSANEVFRDKKRFLRRYYEKIGQLRKEHEVPSRIFLIALGIHLNMDTDRINTMLELAGMGALCPKDRLEGSIAFYLEELYCNYPSIFHPQALQVDPIYAQLRDRKSSCTAQDDGAWKDTTLIELDELLEEPKERLSDYIRRRLEETLIFEEMEQKDLQDLLQLL